jgi:hypothetical protein
MPHLNGGGNRNYGDAEMVEQHEPAGAMPNGARAAHALVAFCDAEIPRGEKATQEWLFTLREQCLDWLAERYPENV